VKRVRIRFSGKGGSESDEIIFLDIFNTVLAEPMMQIFGFGYLVSFLVFSGSKK
jgi:hypothetical protein